MGIASRWLTRAHASFTIRPSPHFTGCGKRPCPQLSSQALFAFQVGAPGTGICVARLGDFHRAGTDAEFLHFISGHGRFETGAGEKFVLLAGDAAYVRAAVRRTIHESLRKT